MSTSSRRRHGPEWSSGRFRPDIPTRYTNSRGLESDSCGPVRLSEVLDQFMGWLKKPSADLLVVVFKEWEKVVGPDVARHCRPVAIDANQLVITADDPMWADELRWNSERVLDRLAEVSGASRLEKLTVRVGYHSQGDHG